MLLSLCAPLRHRWIAIFLLTTLILPAQAQDTSPYTSDNVDTRRNAVIDLRLAPNTDQIAALPALIEILNSEKDGQVRLATFDVLTDLGPDAAPALDALVNTLQSKYGGQDKEELHQDYRAALALAAIGEPAVASLRTLLKEKEENVRAEAIMALGRIGPAAAPAIDDLIPLLDNSSERIRQETTIALGRIGHAALDPLVKSSSHENPATRAAAVAALGHLIPASTEARDTVRACATDPNPLVRAAAITALAALPSSDDALLAESLDPALEDSAESVRRAAVTLLDDPQRHDLLQRLAPRLDALLTNSDPAIVRDAAYTLHRLGPDAAAPRLLDALRNNQAPVEPIADALTLLGPSIGGSLITALNDTDPRVRSASALALGGIRPLVPGTVETLAETLNDTNPNVQSSILTAFGQLGPRAQAAVPAVRRVLDQAQDPALRIRSIDVLARTSGRDEALVSTLTNHLDDPDPAVQREVINTLSALGPLARPALPTIIARLQDDQAEADLRVAAIEFLAGHGPAAADAVPALMVFLNETEKPELRDAALTTLASLGRAAQPALDRLTLLLASENPTLRETTLTTLASLDLDAPTLRPHIAPSLMDDAEGVRRAAGRAIFRLGPNARIFLPDMILAAQKPENRQSVERLLRRYERNGPDPSSIPELITQLQHENETVRTLAAKFLGLAGPAAADAIPALERLQTDDPSEDVRKQAEIARNQIRKTPSPTSTSPTGDSS